MNNLTQAMGFQFNASEVEVTDYTPVPDGEYLASVTEAEITETSSGGTMLVFTMSILTGPHDGRTIKDRLNIVNKNATAQKIAHETLAKICNAVGIVTPSDTKEFIGKRLKIKVVVEQGVGTYVDKFGVEKPRSAQNVIKGYYPADSVAAPVKQEDAENSAPW